MVIWLQKALALNVITLPLQELKIRKGTGRGRGRRSKREALPLVGEEEALAEREALAPAGEEEEADDHVDEGDFGFVEVWVWIV